MTGEDDDIEEAGRREGDDVLIAEGQEKSEHRAGPIQDFSCEQIMAAKLDLPEPAHVSRKEKRKQLKKMRRKQVRQQAAEEERLQESAGLDNPAEQLRIQFEEQIENERLAKEKAEHDEQERLWLEREKKAIEDFQRRQEDLSKEEEARKPDHSEEDLEYVDNDGPAEIIWKGNEIIVRKRRVKVLSDPLAAQGLQDAIQATSNPLPPQSSAFASHSKHLQTPSVLEQTPSFGTEQDKTHCPFHIKTGVCRFGVRCSRVHVYPNQSFTLLMRNMYTGPGLAWENDEGLEDSLLGNLIAEFSSDSVSYLRQNSIEQGFDGRWRESAFGGWMKSNEQPFDDEVAQHYEEFYEDVHSEFLQFGELVNFKVCNNASSHLRGNLYVHYKAEASAQTAYSALNGRFYAGKQITCEFVGVTRWRVALCGEYMKSRHRRCSHGSACNFLHCFRNPRGEYDWADWDSPRPRSWVAKMAKIFVNGNEWEREHDDEFSDDVRRRYRSPDSPPQREHRHSERRNRDRHRHPNRDDRERSTRLKEHRRYENESDDYRPNSEDPARGHRSRRRRDAHKFSSSNELIERDSGHDLESNHGRILRERESSSRDSRQLTADTVEQQQQKRYKIDKGDNQVEGIDRFIHEPRGDTSRVRSQSSNRLFRDADEGSNYKRHRSIDLRESDRRQSLDLRGSSKGRSKTAEDLTPADQTESTTKYVNVKERYYGKGLETKTRRDQSRKSFDDYSSSGSDHEHGYSRHRGHYHGYSERKRKTMIREQEIESVDMSPIVDDRWTGVKEI